MAESTPLEVAAELRSFESGDEQAIVDLYAEIFGKRHTAAHVHWKYHPPWRTITPSMVAVSGKRMVGQYAGTETRLRVGGAEVRAVHGCDVMTAPDARRGGVLTHLGSTAHDRWRDEGARFVYALMHEGWGTRSRALGWEVLFPARWMWLPIPGPHPLSSRYPALERLRFAWGPLLRARHRRAIDHLRRASREVSVREGTPDTSEVDALWHDSSTAFDSLVVRDGAWFRYRYLEAPDHRYRTLLAYRGARLTGYLVFRERGDRGGKRAWLVDRFAAPGDVSTRAALFGWLLETAERSSIASVTALATAPSFGVELRGVGFVPARGRYDVSAVNLGEDPLPIELRSPERWFTMAGDFDVL